MAHTFERYLRRPEHPLQAAFLELFFDLAFIFAFTRISLRLADNLDPISAAQTLVLLLALFWVWTFTAWSTNFFKPERIPIQFVVIGSTFGTVVLAIAVPGAFETRGLADTLKSSNKPNRLGRATANAHLAGATAYSTFHPAWRRSTRPSPTWPASVSS